MFKKIQGRVMADAFVADAAECARVLVERRRKIHPDWEAAARRTASDIGVDYWTLWGLRFRRPKRIYADAYANIRKAYEAEQQRAASRADMERARLHRLRDALASVDAEFHHYEIAALDRAIHAFGGAPEIEGGER